MAEHPKYSQIIAEIKKEFPNFEVIVKEDSKLMKFIYYISLMFLWNNVFMTRYTTVMFGKVYTQKRWIGTEGLYRTLRHERVHLRDAKKFPVLFELSYLLVLPTVFSMRAFWEYRAFKETLKVLAETQSGNVTSSQLDNIMDCFTSSHYLWMFPFRNILKHLFLKFMVEEGILYIKE